MKLLLLIGPLDKLLADKGLSWLTSAGNIALAFLMAHVAVKAVGKVAKTIANGRFKKVQDQPYFTHRVDTAVSLAVSISRYVFYFIAIAVSIGELGLAGAMNSMLAAAGIGTLALGIGAAVMVLVCHKNFTTRHLRRAALISAAFFGWAAWMHYMRASVYTQGGTALLAKLGAWQVALPCMAASLLLWLVLFVLAHKGIAAQAPLYLPGRVITIAVLAVGALAFVLANAMPNLPLPESLHNLLVFNDDWGTYRGVAWRAAFGSWADGSLLRKIVGIGPGMMHTAVAAWAGDAMTARMATFYAAHNEYLEQLLTTGILGLAAWLLLVAAHLRRGERSWNTPGVAPVMLALCSYLAQAVVSIRVSMVFPLVMLLFGVLAALTAPELPQPAAPAPRGKKQQKPEPLPPKNAWYFAKTVLAAVVCMAAASGIAPLLFGFLMG